MSIPVIVISTLISATFLASVVGALTTVWISRKKSLEEDRARVRATYAEAFEAVTAYKEMPYAIRRRREDDPPGERYRLSEESRAIQQKLSYCQAWIRSESDDVGTAYEALVKRLRATAGQACHEAWKEPPARTDAEMNISPDAVDLTALDAYESAFMTAAQQDLRRRNTWRAAVPRRSRKPPELDA